MSINTHEFQIGIDHEVNRPNFSTYIRINETATTKEVYKIDASANNSNITYANKALTFHTSDSIKWNIGTEYYITLDEGVLFSVNTTNSTARTDPKFWTWKCVDDVSSNSSSNGTNATTSSTTLRTLLTGEPPLNRSTQLGMGFGITFIGIIIIGEIIYFKYFYRGNLRSGNYLA